MRRCEVFAVVVLVLASMLRAGTADASTTHAGPFVYVKQMTGGAPNSAVSRSADCPSGTKLTGAGGAISTPSTGLTWMTTAKPMDSVFGGDGNPDNFATATGWNGSPDAYATVSSVAICMKGTAASSLVYGKSSLALSNTAGRFTRSATCSGDLIGGGGGLTRTDGGASLDETTPTASGWEVGEYQSADQTGNQLSSVAVCLPSGVKNVRLVSPADTATANEGEIKTFSVHCPARRHVSAGGVHAYGILILKSTPFDDGDADHAPDDGWTGTVLNQGIGPAFFSVNAICVK